MVKKAGKIPLNGGFERKIMDKWYQTSSTSHFKSFPAVKSLVFFVQIFEQHNMSRSELVDARHCCEDYHWEMMRVIGQL